MRPEGALFRLAGLHGVQARYRSIDRQLHTASPATIVAVLRALGVAIDRVDDAPAALRATCAERHARVVPDCSVAWVDPDQDATVAVRVPEASGGKVEVSLGLEDGDSRELRTRLDRCETEAVADGDGSVVDRHVPLPPDLPPGVHRVDVHAAGRDGSGALIVAPRRCPDPGARDWGVFAPIHALSGPHRRGPGNLDDLDELARQVHGHGGALVATLPLLATFLDGPVDPSPYSPVSRLAWNECYLDPRAIPGDPGPREGAGTPPPDDRGLVDWTVAWRDTDARLQSAADRMDAATGAELDAFGGTQPLLAEYAAFRAARERHGSDWRRWPTGALDGADPRRVRRHLLGQYAMHTQLEALRDRFVARGQALVLDLPLGSHRDGFDTYRFPESFATGASAGAPPDDFYEAGQVWGFPPLHPQQPRRGGHELLRACLRAHLRYAGVLRLDHVMALHRLYWVPDGATGRDGAYVRYPEEELYALVALEASRVGAEIAGEDLGTVPEVVRRAMRRHALARLFVVEAELDGQADALDPPARCVASIDTHDLPPFAQWWRTRDDQQRRHVLAVLARSGQPPDDDGAAAVLDALLAVLGASRARHVLVALEDLWLEERAQNVPGTGADAPNWRGRLRRDLGEVGDDDRVRAALRDLDRSRRRA